MGFLFSQGFLLELHSFFLSCIGIKHILSLLASSSFFVLLLACTCHFFLLGSFGLNCFSQIFFFFLLLSYHLKMFLSIRSISHLGFLIIFVVNLCVVLVLSSTSAVLALHPSFFKVTLLLRHESSVLSIESILELQETCIILGSEIHTHKL